MDPKQSLRQNALYLSQIINTKRYRNNLLYFRSYLQGFSSILKNFKFRTQVRVKLRTKLCGVCSAPSTQHRLNCGHLICSTSCMIKTMQKSLQNGFQFGIFLCQHKNCGSPIPQQDITRRITPIQYQKLKLRYNLSQLPKFNCKICSQNFLISEGITLDCQHRFCPNCLKQMLQISIKQNQVGQQDLVCPQCSKTIDINIIKANISHQQWNRYTRFSIQGWRPQDKTQIYFKCPGTDCPYAIIINSSIPFVQCPRCDQKWCAKCKQKYHPQVSCQSYSQWKKENNGAEQSISTLLQQVGWKRCPQCGAICQKEAGCNFMSCGSAQCKFKTFFCYICSQELTVIHKQKKQHFSHFTKGPFNNFCLNKPSQMVESSTFQIKIRSLDSSQFELPVTNSMLVSDLKHQISLQTQVPSNLQRLIYQGKLLNNSDLLSVYNLNQGHVIQLIPNNQPPPQQTERQIPDLFRLATPPTDLFPRRRRRLNRRRDIDTSERLQTIRQTLQTLEGIQQTLTDLETTEAFDLSHREYFRGQWVDVKDTVDQWLQAQVIDFQHTVNGTLVYVHYNGWPNRWDEWINSCSPRIQPFRTHTYQSLTSPMQSPHPVIAPDAEGVRPPSCPDMNEFMLQTMTTIDFVKSMMDKFYSLSTLLRHQEVGGSRLIGETMQEEKKQEDLGSRSNLDELDFRSEISDLSDQVTLQQQLALLTVQLAPVLDRTGRMLTDIALIMAGNQRVPDDSASVSSSLVTNESGNSGSSAPRLTMQVPVMPSPLELSNSNPRALGPDIDIHVHAIVSQRPEYNEVDRNSCWRQIT